MVPLACSTTPSISALLYMQQDHLSLANTPHQQTSPFNRHEMSDVSVAAMLCNNLPLVK
jgi:hypothetical protein